MRRSKAGLPPLIPAGQIRESHRQTQNTLNIKKIKKRKTRIKPSVQITDNTLRSTGLK